jgi:single-strand DNA-binding protein
LKKGSKVMAEGRLASDPKTGSPRIYQRNDGTVGTSFELVASTVRFLSDRQMEPAAGGEPVHEDDEEIPF